MTGKNDKETFMRLFLANQRRIFAYILMFIPNRTDAEDMLQETAFWMWENFDKFTPGTSFGAWGVQVSKYKILNMKRAKNNSCVKFRSDVLEMIDSELGSLLEEVDDRTEALQKCLTKVSEKDRKLLFLRYEKGLRINKMAEIVERPVHSLYKSMARVHRVLLQCVRHSLAWETES